MTYLLIGRELTINFVIHCYMQALLYAISNMISIYIYIYIYIFLYFIYGHAQQRKSSLIISILINFLKFIKY